MSEKHKKVCKALDYFERFLVFVSAVSGCISISAFTSLVNVAVGIASSAVGFKILQCLQNLKNMSIIKKKKKKHNAFVVS